MECLVLWHRAIPVLDEQEDPGAHDAWTDDLALRARDAGGRVVLRVGSTLVVLFEMHDTHIALAWGLETLRRADALDQSMAGLRVALGVAVGDVEEHGAVLVGAAFDRAQLLANRARFGELVLDPACQAIAREAFLFSRTVNTGSAGLRGDSIDRNHAFLADCREGLGHLRRAGLLQPVEEASRVIVEAARRGGSVRLILRGPSGAGARRLCAKLVEDLTPPLVLRVAGVPGGLEPLGSLRLALAHQFGSEEAVLAAFDSLDEAQRGRLIKLVRGDVLPFDEACTLLHAMLSRGPDQGKSVVLLDPVGGIDPSTLKVLNEVIDEPGAEAVLVVRLPEEGRVPAAFTARGVVEFSLPRLTPALARSLACMVLGEPEGSGLASRVAAIGGDTPLGVIEAARALVAAGDLIHEGGRFRFRLSPPTVDGAVPLERLLADRLRGVPPVAHRVLEMVCLLPQGAGEDALGVVASQDGISLEEQAAALDALAAGWLLEHRTEWRPTSEQLRHVVLGAMPPARRAELYRFVAEAVRTDGPSPVFAGATLAFYLAEGGDAEAGATGLLTAAVAAADSGHLRSALRLAAAAVQFLPDEDTRRVAAHVTQTIKRREREANPARTSLPGESTDTNAAVGAAATVRAIDAMRARDFEGAERYVELGIAQGRSLAAADRLRVALAVLRGSASAARVAFGHMQNRGGVDGPPERARAALALALILLQEGDGKAAVRESLRALQTARAASDARGEAAALRTLAICYRALDRREDADALVARAQPMAPPPSTSMV